MDFMYSLSVLSYVLISISFTAGQKCYDTGNFTTGDTYANNRNLILSSLATNVQSKIGFFTDSTGQFPKEVHALAICRGDLTLTECARCITSTSQDIMTECPNQIEAFMWGPSCFVRYANHPFSGKLELDPVHIVYNGGNLTLDMTQFDKIWEGLMDSLWKKATMNYTRFRFATGEANLTLFQTIYAQMQCAPYLSQIDCDSCLRQNMAEYQICCHAKQGGVVEGPNCMLRWDLYPFYNDGALQRINPLPPPTSMPTLPPSSMPTPSTIMPDEERRERKENRAWIAVVTPVSAIVVVVLLGSFLWHMRRRTKRDKANSHKVRVHRFGKDRNENDCEYDCQEFPLFPLDLMLVATGNFSNENKLGEGGFGPVYKGILSNGPDRLPYLVSMAKAREFSLRLSECQFTRISSNLNCSCQLPSEFAPRRFIEGMETVV
ncbi:hypothetical protein LWI28_011921 [Acer negundo]|uniref:Gnk2-homologous domain-containing protein n=1 Tax=Acer negundo TaxID=4023 RepID=A0AAD5JQ34_ACENE|nr:hypothetical protein LWI28_011921 [Acer negundo]